TKAKTERCPDCDFSTVDPGSLTRHRKRIHGYVPKARRSRQPPPPKPTQMLPVAGPSNSSTSTTRPFEVEAPSQQPFSSREPSQSRRQSSTSSSYPHNPHTQRAQEPYHEHRLPKYDPQPPHQVQLPPIRFIPQPRMELAPCYSRLQPNSFSRSPSVDSDSGSSSFSFSATAPFATRSPPSPRPIVLPPLQPPQTHTESECTPKVKTAPSRRRAMDF
ncbi:hypothetical protein PQX77_016040, partial [Marasmius sp. AFHP31]